MRARNFSRGGGLTGYIEETQFRATYVELIDRFTEELVATQLQGTDRFRQILSLQTLVASQQKVLSDHGASRRHPTAAERRWQEDDQRQTVFAIFERGVSPILSNARETTDEPIQQEPYLPLLKLFAQDYRAMIAQKQDLFGDSTKSAFELFSFEKILIPTFSFLQEDLIMQFLTEGEGETNVFNYLTLSNLTEVLKRADLRKDVKTLAIRRYLEATSRSKVEEDESEAYLNLVSYTTFFSDKYEKTSTYFGKVTGDAKVLLLTLLKSHMLYSDFAPSDLPPAL